MKNVEYVKLKIEFYEAFIFDGDEYKDKFTENEIIIYRKLLIDLYSIYFLLKK